MKAKTGKWTFEELNAFLKSPKAFVPGTNMGFAGLPRDTERADVINYLRTLADKPVPLPKVAKKASPAKRNNSTAGPSPEAFEWSGVPGASTSGLHRLVPECTGKPT